MVITEHLQHPKVTSSFILHRSNEIVLDKYSTKLMNFLNTFWRNFIHVTRKQNFFSQFFFSSLVSYIVYKNVMQWHCSPCHLLCDTHTHLLTFFYNTWKNAVHSTGIRVGTGNAKNSNLFAESCSLMCIFTSEFHSRTAVVWHFNALLEDSNVYAPLF